MKAISELDLDGYAIGGLAVGESAEEMYRIIEAVEPYAPKNKVRYLMGVGTPVNILEAVRRGVDLFDCVMPSRNARHAHLFTWSGRHEDQMMPVRFEGVALIECDIPSGTVFQQLFLQTICVPVPTA